MMIKWNLLWFLLTYLAIRCMGIVMKQTAVQLRTLARRTVRNLSKSVAKLSSYHNGEPSEVRQTRHRFFFFLVSSSKHSSRSSFCRQLSRQS